MLKNVYLDAKIGIDPAENEPSKVSAPNLSLVRQYTESRAEETLLVAVDQRPGASPGEMLGLAEVQLSRWISL